MFCWTADLYEPWVQLCRSWSQPGSWQCRCTHRSVQGGRWGQQGNILGHRTQMWSGHSQREARRPATDQSTISMVLDHNNKTANFTVTCYLAVLPSWLYRCKIYLYKSTTLYLIFNCLQCHRYSGILKHHTLYHRISGSGFPSTTTARRDVSPMCTSTSSMMVSNLGGTTKKKERSNDAWLNIMDCMRVITCSLHAV